MELLEALMKKLTLLLFVGVLFVACQPAATSEPTSVIPPTSIPPTQLPLSLQEVVNAWQEALNNGNIDTALSYLTEDAVVTVSPAGPEGDAVFTGTSEIRGWYETLTAAKGITTLSNCTVDGEKMTCLDTYTDEGLKSMGVDFIEGDWIAIFKEGKIRSYTFTTTPESLAKLVPPPEPTPKPTSDPVIEQLAGIYITNIGSEGTEYGIDKGQYLLKLMKDLRWFIVDPNDGFGYVQGNYNATTDQIVFKDSNGPAAGSCTNKIENAYGWSVEVDKLTFIAISVNPECDAQKFFFTQQPFTLQP